MFIWATATAHLFFYENGEMYAQKKTTTTSLSFVMKGMKLFLLLCLFGGPSVKKLRLRQNVDQVPSHERSPPQLTVDEASSIFDLRPPCNKKTQTPARLPRAQGLGFELAYFTTFSSTFSIICRLAITPVYSQLDSVEKS
ncbi:hypothetical protein M2298_000900 [Brevibacillus sp. 1238]|nr:hypothetical protein [Brevibacillus sp. 1238]